MENEQIQIKQIQIFRHSRKYPTLGLEYHVKIKGHNPYIKMNSKTLGIFSRFKWKVFEVTQRIPEDVDQLRWETHVNQALSKSKTFYKVPRVDIENIFSKG